MIPVINNNNILQVEENTAQSMKMLVEIDTVKSRMQDASRALQVRFTYQSIKIQGAHVLNVQAFRIELEFRNDGFCGVKPSC